MAVYEFNPNPYIEDYIPYLDGMTEEEFKSLILDMRELYANATYKLISNKDVWYFYGYNSSVDVLYNNLIPFLLMNNLARVFKNKGNDSFISKIIIVFNRKDKKESTIEIAENILHQYDDFIENSGPLFLKEVKNIAEDLEELHW